MPSDNARKEFIHELTRLFNSYAQASAMESVPLDAIMVACLSTLLLQKPHHSSQTRDHANALERRLPFWRTGDIDTLLHKGCTIQQHLDHWYQRRHFTPDEEQAHQVKIFSKLVMQGKVYSALHFLSEQHGGGVLSLQEPIDASGHTVCGVPNEKQTILTPLP